MNNTTAQQDASEIAAIWDAALSDAAFYVLNHCENGKYHAEAIMGMPPPKITPLPVPLMAAAPELLAALQWARATLGRTSPCGIAADAAIAKALGQQPQEVPRVRGQDDPKEQEHG